MENKAVDNVEVDEDGRVDLEPVTCKGDFDNYCDAVVEQMDKVIDERRKRRSTRPDIVHSDDPALTDCKLRMWFPTDSIELTPVEAYTKMDKLDRSAASNDPAVFENFKSDFKLHEMAGVSTPSELAFGALYSADEAWRNMMLFAHAMTTVDRRNDEQLFIALRAKLDSVKALINIL